MRNTLLIISLAALGLAGRAQEKSQPLMIGDDAPEFKVAHWLKNPSGLTLQAGEINVVEFWATWCGPCLANIPHLSKVAGESEGWGVQVFWISVLERKGVGFDSLRRFIAGPKGQTMHYIVGADDTTKFMSTQWLNATGHMGIPFAMVIDKKGKIAWMGHPVLIDRSLAKIVSGDWDLATARAQYLENIRLDAIDNSIIPAFNSYLTTQNFTQGLKAIDSLLLREPALKYRFYTAHYTFVCLLRTDGEKAVSFARATWAASDIPDWKGVSDMIEYMQSKHMQLPRSASLLGIDALLAQLEHYPWSMDFPATYDEIASLEFLVGDREKAAAYESKAIASADDGKHTSDQVEKYRNNLKKYL